MIIVNNSGVITSEENFRTMNPLVSFPMPLKAADLESYGMSFLQEVPAPAYSSFYTVQQGAPVLVDSVWTQTWSQTAIDLQSAITQQLSNLALARYNAQIAPVTIDSVSINADPTSLLMLNSTIAFLNGSTMATVNFKAASGWTALSLAQLQAFSTAINAQIQACFTNEFVHTQNIIALTSTDAVATYDITTGW
jgi:hypothetical protein